MSATVKQRVQVSVAADCLEAWLKLSPDSDMESDRAPLTAEELTVALQAAKVAIDEIVEARIAEFIEQLKQVDEQPAAFLIAEGCPPREGEDGEFVWADPEGQRNDQSDHEEGRIDYRTINMIRTVEEGEIIGRVVPPKPGTPGVDVHGTKLSPKQRLEEIGIGDNVSLNEDGQTAVATAPGRVVLDGNKLSICEVLEIDGDVDFKSGNVDATIDVDIRGTVRDLFRVQSKKCIKVSNSVEAATLEAGGDIVVRGGVLGRNKGSVKAKGKIAVKHCDDADLRAEDDIFIANEAINSRVHTSGALMAERAAIIGGQIRAQSGVRVHTLGSDGCVPTKVHVGIPLFICKQARDTEAGARKHEETAKKIRDTVQSLLADRKRLSLEQKEKATELLCQADEIEAVIEARREKMAALVAAHRPPGPPAITVNGRICENVVIAINDRQICFNQEMKGPLRIEQRRVDNVTEFVAVNTLTGSITALNSTESDLNEFEDEPQAEEDAQDPASIDSTDQARTPSR